MGFAVPTTAAQFAIRVAAESNLCSRAAKFIGIADGVKLSEVPQKLYNANPADTRAHAKHPGKAELRADSRSN
jgi:hypothetical protein